MAIGPRTRRRLEVLLSLIGSAGVDPPNLIEKIIDSKSIFTFKEIEYTIPYQGGERMLLNNVSGYSKPGIMVALMCTSGAGK